MSSSDFWVFLYLMQLLLLSLALGSLTLHLPKWLMVPRLTRFLIGFCVTPFVLGVWMLGLATLLPGSPRWLFLMPLPTVATGFLILYGPRTIRRIMHDYFRTQRLTKSTWPVYLMYVGMVVVIIALVPKLIANGRDPVTGSDALQYLSEALPFADARSISAANSFRGTTDGTLRGDVHGFLWPAFLSYGLITTGDNPLGYPHDHAVRVAFQSTVVYMLLSVMALAATVTYAGMGALTLLFLLQVPQFEYISIASSRDGFRIIPLVLLAATLTGLSPQRLRRPLGWMSLIPPLILAAFSLGGHTLDGIVVVAMVLAWVIWVVPGKGRWVNILLVLGAVGMGLLLNGTQYVQAYIETGHVQGQDFYRDTAIAGTPLEEAWLEQLTSRLQGTTNTVERLALLLSRDQYTLSVTGLLGAVGAVLLWTRSIRVKRASPIPFWGLVALAVALPFTGLFDIGFKFSEWFVRNFRYSLHWYPFAAVCVASLFRYGYDVLISRSYRFLRILATVVMTLLVLVLSYSAYQTITSKWRIADLSEKWLSENIAPLESVASQVPAGQRLLLDGDDFNYYLRNQGVLMYSRPTWDVIQANSDSEVQSALTKLDIGAVVLQEANIPGYWDRTALFGFLNDPGNAAPIFNRRFRLYQIVENDLERRRLLEAYLKEAGEKIPEDYVLRLMETGFLDPRYGRVTFPFRWQGAETVSMQDLPATAPPLMVQGNRGDFTFSRILDETGDVIRVSPGDSTTASARVIQFGPWLQDNGEGLRLRGYQSQGQENLDIRPDQVVFLSLWARLSSPAETAELFIQDRTGTWQRNTAPMSGTAWQRYAIARQISAGATEVILGVEWKPKTGQEWLDIKAMHIFTLKTASQP